MTERHVVMLSGGLSSWLTSMLVKEKHGTPDMLFTDTLIEDEDLYRFLIEGAAACSDMEINKVKSLTKRCNKLPDIREPDKRLAALKKLAEDAQSIIPKLHWQIDGRTPWQLFKQIRFIGNSRRAKCSHVLKQDIARNWLKLNCTPESTSIYVGIHWSEMERYAGNTKTKGAKKLWEPWKCLAPLCDKPFRSPEEVNKYLEEFNIRKPRLYEMKFPHNNCGGFCVKAGHGSFRNLLTNFPDRYKYHEEQEELMREFLQKDVAILKDRRGGKLTPLPLAKFKTTSTENDCHDTGGCACFNDEDEE